MHYIKTSGKLIYFCLWHDPTVLLSSELPIFFPLRIKMMFKQTKFVLNKSRQQKSLLLSSLAITWFLFVACVGRKEPLPRWFFWCGETVLKSSRLCEGCRTPMCLGSLCIVACRLGSSDVSTAGRGNTSVTGAMVVDAEKASRTRCLWQTHHAKNSHPAWWADNISGFRKRGSVLVYVTLPKVLINHVINEKHRENVSAPLTYSNYHDKRDYKMFYFYLTRANNSYVVIL